MQKKSKNLYLYPNGEDTQAAFLMIKELQKQNYMEQREIFVVDDSLEATSIASLENDIKRGELWIIHQDKDFYHRLLENAKDFLPKNGIEALEQIFLKAIENFDFEWVKENVVNEHFLFLSYASYFCLHFWISLGEESAFVKAFKQLTFRANDYFLEYFNLQTPIIGIQVTPFSAGKHLGEIGEFLEKRNLRVCYVYYDEESYESLPLSKRPHSICFPLQSSYMGIFFNIFQLYVTCRMPLTSPNWGQKYIYVSHAYIDPIAALYQRNRPLDDFWFKKKMGINGFRMVTSASNYKIFEEKFLEYGYKEELVCAGYPSLDSYILEYSKVPLIANANTILIAINDTRNLVFIKELLKSLNSKQKVILRPHPGSKKEDYQEILNLPRGGGVFYDTSNRLSAEKMAECLCLIGDYSSLVYTFPLTTLKPAILIGSESQNTYKGISFYNPSLHFCARNIKECLESIEKIRNEDKKQRAKAIWDYREKEVFNLGNSSAFIADFIFKQMKHL
ncbi:CDP-glycerol glycerophosphotransferase family protein [Helicobacter mesocricetorum]|uniref:CDP-glycerol glycerophosphotransferase family protein n=1 Tax=Helicobacter mesocricetorum TaxID=87012 RepID=UPI000CF16F3E|nr:CDP-glycerol glycerophosphotransferase family protein [Helicobacter mesocricetorum]